MKKIIYYFTLILLCSEYNFGQQLNESQLDSLYNLFVKTRSHIYNNQSFQPENGDTTVVKCTFELAAEIKVNYNNFSLQQQQILNKLLSRPSSDASFVTPNGFFRVHYSTSGINAPGYNLSDLAAALDSSYNFEVNYLGFPPPPGDSTSGTDPSLYGGDNKYDIYITNLNPYSDGYGYTQPENSANNGPDTYTSYMVIDNDFGSGFYTHGINAARVTVAHEFHHSIQIGNYIYRDSDRFFFELTSTSMEDFVFSTVNDYYNYMPDYFDNPDRCFSDNNGYNLAIWNIYLKDNYGFDIIKKQWQFMPQMRAMNAINSSLNSYGSNFKFDLNRFGIWTYYTGYRAIPGRYFLEASNYPLLAPISVSEPDY